MKKKRILLLLSGLLLTNCSLVKGMEHELTVVFTYKDQIVKKATTSEFKNAMPPSLTAEEIPYNHEFYGWTWLDPDSLSIVDSEFENQYIAYDDIVHYHEVKEYAFNSVVTLKPVFINIDDIPIPNYYLAIGWYMKTSTSGLSQKQIDTWTIDLKEFLKSKGASEEDLSNVIINGYDGDVATAGSLINKDRYIDLLIGFGNNINTTGGVEIIEKTGGIPMGEKTRYIARLTEKETAVDVYNWLMTEEGYKGLK